MNAEKSRPGSRKWLWVVALLVAAAAAGYWWYSGHAQSSAPAPVAAEKVEGPKGVSCLGRVEPDGGVIHVAGARIPGDPHAPVVETIHVKAGDHVRKGAVLAVFVGRNQLMAALEHARSQIAVARRRLEQVKAGVKKPDLAAQRSDTARLEAELQNARTELERYQTLRRSNDVTATEVDARRTAVETLQRSIEASNHRLESLEEVRDSDVHVAEAELEAAVAGERRAQRDLEVSTVYSPMDGEVLKIRAHAGEEAGPEGLLDLGRTDHMYVIAEVYETDIVRVKVGQHATVSGDLLGTETLTGTVDRIEPNVKQASVLPGDTAAFADKRIVEARIRLDKSDALAELIDGKVTVVIQP